VEMFEENILRKHTSFISRCLVLQHPSSSTNHALYKFQSIHFLCNILHAYLLHMFDNLHREIV
jgi:hypothetical protein